MEDNVWLLTEKISFVVSIHFILENKKTGALGSGSTTVATGVTRSSSRTITGSCPAPTSRASRTSAATSMSRGRTRTVFVYYWNGSGRVDSCSGRRDSGSGRGGSGRGRDGSGSGRGASPSGRVTSGSDRVEVAAEVLVYLAVQVSYIQS